MYCRNCGETLGENQAVCLRCGVKTGDGKNFCPNCANPTDANAAICVHCGATLNSASNQELNGQDKVVIILICLFLGGLGIHNFMMGETKKGIFRIIMSLCCGLGSIFALIDLIKIAVGSYVVDPTKLV